MRTHPTLSRWRLQITSHPIWISVCRLSQSNSRHDTWGTWYRVVHHNTGVFPQNIHKRHSIAHLWWQVMEGILWVKALMHVCLLMWKESAIFLKYWTVLWLRWPLTLSSSRVETTQPSDLTQGLQTHKACEHHNTWSIGCLHIVGLMGTTQVCKAWISNHILKYYVRSAGFLGPCQDKT